MAYFHIPSKRTRQPQWDARLDSGWRWGVNFSSGPASREVVSKVLGTTGGDPVASGYSQGVGIKLSSASSQYWQGPIANRPASFPISFVASFVVNNLSVAARIFTSGMAYNYAGLFFWVSPAGSVYLGYGNDTSFVSAGEGNYFISTADGTIVVGKTYALAAKIKSGSITLFVNGSPVTGTLSGSASTIVNNGAPLVGRLTIEGFSFHSDATVGMVALGDLDLPSSELQSLSENPWQIFAPDPRRLYFAPSGGGTTTNERTVAARTKARGTAATTAIHAATTAGRIRARAADAVVPIHVETIAGRVTARGADARTSIHAGTAAGRVKARGTDTVAPLRTESAAGRIRAKATNTVEHIDAGAVSRTIAGKVRARGAAATLAIRHTSIVGRVKAKAAEAGTSTRLSLAAGRVRTRAAIAAAPVVAGMVVTTAAGRIQARGAIATTATRIEAIAGRVTARGTDTANSIRTAVTAGRLRSRGRATAGPYVAPTLPLEIPPSTRTIDRDPTRLGRSPLSPTKPRLG